MKPENFERAKRLMKELEDAEMDMESIRIALRDIQEDHGTAIAPYNYTSEGGIPRYKVSRGSLKLLYDRLEQRTILHKTELKSL